VKSASGRSRGPLAGTNFWAIELHFLGVGSQKAQSLSQAKSPIPLTQKKYMLHKKNTLCATIAENKFVEEKTDEF
jgi:hypothetical protein